MAESNGQTQPTQPTIRITDEQFAPTTVNVKELIAATVDAVTSYRVQKYPTEIAALVPEYYGNVDDIITWFKLPGTEISYRNCCISTRILRKCRRYNNMVRPGRHGTKNLCYNR
ncbi:hypothetical protein QE152_g22291 [Popillia japonica]|uniref:Uncharacterized protein n=1 Tax=Popillia japonica TaxID=7064 RepID=A0AAW1KKS1_POPJA